MDFIDKLKRIADEEYNTAMTENGAFGYKSSGQALLDINFAVASLRDASYRDIVKLFSKAYFANPALAVRWLFFAADVRGGLGERRLFRACLYFLLDVALEATARLLPLIPEYTRWDNLIYLLDTPLGDTVFDIVKSALDADLRAMADGKPVSLLAKWMPSINASSEDSRYFAKDYMHRLGMTAKTYRKTLSALRAYLKIVEVDMSAGRFSEIRYETVPSKANLHYSDAFLRNDKKRRTKYLKALASGATKINASVLYPHDIVHKYFDFDSQELTLRPADETLEQLWKALPDYAPDNNTICVADGSGSMLNRIGKTGVTALDVANALAIYFAERSTGAYKNKYITFSAEPQLVDFSGCASLRDKIAHALAYNEVANTNIEGVFGLILDTAVTNKLDQSELPHNILIISDMEFDDCAVSAAGSKCQNIGLGVFFHDAQVDKKLFKVIGKRYAEHGYKLPRLIFWNVNSRTGAIPMCENELGVALISGFSPILAKAVLSNEYNPYKLLLELIGAERYDIVQTAFAGCDET